MEMSRGLLKLSNAANNIEARKDFAKLITIAKEQGKSHLAIKYIYPENASWRVIDKHIKGLREALKRNN
jgi:hypothetical protein